MKTKTTMTSLPMTRRSMLLATYGPGPRPCVDGAANWLGCTHCSQSCMLEPGHQLAKEDIEMRLAALKLARKYKAGRRPLRVKAVS